MNCRYALLAILALAGSAVAAEEASVVEPVPEYEGRVRAILESACMDCHGNGAAEAGVSFDELTSAALAYQKRPLWKRAIQRVKLDQMPPEGSEPLSPEDKQALLTWMSHAIEFVDCDPVHRDPGPPLLRRLNKEEYDNTLSDLFGMDLPVSGEVGLRTEAVIDGFHNQAQSMTLDTALVEKYFAGTDVAIKTVFGEMNLNSQRRGRRRLNNRELEQLKKTVRDELIFLRPNDETTEDEQRSMARAVIERFAKRAFRRPVEEIEVDRLMTVYDRVQGEGGDYDASIKAMLKPVLISPHFLFRVERSPEAGSDTLGAPVDPWELATRLSYFLWSSMPDGELFEAAESGKLLEDEELRHQVRRMLADDRAESLTENFAVQWLQLEKLEQARPQTQFFPTFNNRLKADLRTETTMFFDSLRKENGSLLDLLDSSYTFANDSVAEHYGLQSVKGKEFQRVELPADSRRGGLLGMGSILAMTSHSHRTSPTLRGKYVLDVIFGTPPPPPPPDAGMIKGDRRNQEPNPKTFRELLAQHASEPSCAGCHAKIDPLGFAMDNYNAVGQWRESTKDEPLDVSGVLPDGTKLNGVSDLKQVLLERKQDFTRNLVEKTFTYALGREVDYYDECSVREVQQALAEDDYRFSSLFENIVLSRTFRERRPSDSENIAAQ